MHNIGGTVTIQGDVSLHVLEKAIQQFIRNNEGVRLRIKEEGGHPFQFVAEYKEMDIPLFDFSRLPDSQQKFNHWVHECASKPFELYEDAPLYEFFVYKREINKCGYFVKLHHMIADGWSIRIMTEQISRNYELLLVEETIQPVEGISYIDYLEIENDYLQSDRFHKDRIFWNTKYQTLPPMSSLRDEDEHLQSKRQTLHLDTSISANIKQVVKRYRISLNTFFAALFILYLHKTEQQDDIVIGTPVLNRYGKKERSIFGMFTSTVPFRMRIHASTSVEDFLLEVNKELIQCYFHQKYPYDLLIQDLELGKQGYEGLFHACVNYYNTKLDTVINGLPVENIEFHSGQQLYPLQLVVKDWSDIDSLTLDLDYKTSLFTDKEIEMMLSRIERLTRVLPDMLETPIQNIQVLSDDEWNKTIITLNSTYADFPSNSTIHELFQDQVSTTPQAIAAEMDGETLTYEELNNRADALACYLIDRGVERHSTIGIMMKHSLDVLVGILGILKAGGAYVPIDVEYPSERILYIVEDSGASLVLTNTSCDAFKDISIELVRLDEMDLNRYVKVLPTYVEPTDLAYMIYTSGSTGQPKCAMIEHRGLINYIWWAKNQYIRDSSDVFALYSSLSFDLTVTSIFTPLISGNRIAIYQDDGTESILNRIIRDKRASIIKLTPSHLLLLKDCELSDSVVHTLIVGGEDLKVSLADSISKQFHGKVTIYNEYGPTETTVGCMIDEYREDIDLEGSVPIGQPISNMKLYILDKYLAPLPVGAIGELFISGVSVARGYWNRPELTEERFLNNPFQPGERMYRTGDLVRWRDDGRMEYIGRMDQQVKIRGHRIELGEIESQLLTLDHVEDAVVVSRSIENDQYVLCAYIQTNRQISEGEIAVHLRNTLPSYMVPQYFVCVPQLPLTPNGKVDRKALPDPVLKSIKSDSVDLFLTEKEQKIVSILEVVLQRQGISLNDNFFYLGGDSIKAIQGATKFKEAGLKVKVKDFLSHPVISDLVMVVEDIQTLEPSTYSEPVEGEIKPSPILSWFLEQPLVNRNYFNQSVLLHMKSSISQHELCKCLSTLVQHHDMLRTNYNATDDTFYYNPVHKDRPMQISWYDLSDKSYEEQQSRMESIGTQLKSQMNLEKGLLFKASVFELGPERGNRLLLTAHHVVVDAVSWRIIIDDLVRIIAMVKKGELCDLPEKTASYQLWSNQLREYSERISDEEISYWSSVHANSFRFTKDTMIGTVPLGDVQTLKASLSPEDTSLLWGPAHQSFGTETHELLVISLAIAISEFSSQREIVIELEGHGREELSEKLDITRTVGWFTSIYPIQLEVPNLTLLDQIKSLKEQLRSIPGKGIGYGILKHTRQVWGDMELVRRIRFNYLGDFSTDNGENALTIVDEPTGSETDSRNPLTCLMDIQSYRLHNQLHIECIYHEGEFDKESMEQLLICYKSTLEGVVKYGYTNQRVEFTPSDFSGISILQEELDGILD